MKVFQRNCGHWTTVSEGEEGEKAVMGNISLPGKHTGFQKVSGVELPDQEGNGVADLEG